MRPTFEEVVKATGKNFYCEKSSFEDDYYILMCDDEIVLNDSANEDQYGTEEDVKGYFMEYLLIYEVPEDKKTFRCGMYFLKAHTECEKNNMKTEELRTRINALASPGEGPVQIEILKEVELPGAAMYVIRWSCDNGFGNVSSFILYADGVLFHQSDWQAGHPETAEEIADFSWLSEDGTSAVVLDGLPRTFA